MHRCLVASVVVLAGCGLVLDVEPGGPDGGDGTGVDGSADGTDRDPDAKPPDGARSDGAMLDSGFADTTPVDGDDDDDDVTSDGGSADSDVDDPCFDGIDNDGDGFADEDCFSCTRVTTTAGGGDDMRATTGATPFATIGAAIAAAQRDPIHFRTTICVGTPDCVGGRWAEHVFVPTGFHVTGSSDSNMNYRLCSPYPRGATTIERDFAAAPSAIQMSDPNGRLSHVTVISGDGSDYSIGIDANGPGATIEDVHVTVTGTIALGIVLGGAGARVFGTPDGRSDVTVTGSMESIGIEASGSGSTVDWTDVSMDGVSEAAMVGVHCAGAGCSVRDTRVSMNVAIGTGILLAPSSPGTTVVGEYAVARSEVAFFACATGSRVGMQVHGNDAEIENSVVRLFDPSCGAGAFSGVGVYVVEDGAHVTRVRSSTIDARFVRRDSSQCSSATNVKLQGSGGSLAVFRNDILAMGGCSASAAITLDGFSSANDFRHCHFEMDPAAAAVFFSTAMFRRSYSEIMSTEAFMPSSGGVGCLRPDFSDLVPLVGSLCVDRALAAESPPNDVTNVDRDLMPDIGAYEYRTP